MNRTRMQKLTLFSFILVLLLSSTNTYAQRSLRFGIKGGYDVLDRRINKDVLKGVNRTGFQIGATLDVPIGASFGTNISLLYTQRDYSSDSLANSSASIDIDKEYWLDIPVNLTYTIPVANIAGIVFSAGPYVSCKLDGGDIHSRQIVDTYRDRTFLLGANFGIGVDITSHFNVGLTYHTVLTDSYKDISPEIEDVFRKRPDRMSLNATLYF